MLLEVGSPRVFSYRASRGGSISGRLLLQPFQWVSEKSGNLALWLLSAQVFLLIVSAHAGVQDQVLRSHMQLVSEKQLHSIFWDRQADWLT